MPNLETLPELAEAIADMAGVYGGRLDSGDHPYGCRCRSCFVEDMTERIRKACANEAMIEREWKADVATED